MEENERDAERYEYEIDTERDRSPCYEEARVERNVRDFVDEDVDLLATPVGSDDDQDGNEGDGYFTYKKGSGELQLKQAFDSLQAFKQAMVDYVLKHGWNVKYVRWDKDKSELKCASEAEEGEEACMWRIYCSYEAPLQKWMVKVYVKDHSCSKSGYSRLITQEVIAKLFKDDLRDDPKIMPKEILVDIQKRWELTVTIDQCRNAKTRALEMIKEENDQQFSRLRDYRVELLEKQYETPIKAVHGINFWKKTGDAEIIPPPTEPESSRGRKKIPKRIKGRNESPSKKKTKVRNESPSKVSRERRIIHCGRCGEGGHNARKCKNIGVPVQRPPKKKNVTQVEGSNQPTQSQVVD
ncbi:hypothetical protein YC2023_094972 [Brassica napus]